MRTVCCIDLPDLLSLSRRAQNQDWKYMAVGVSVRLAVHFVVSPAASSHQLTVYYMIRNGAPPSSRCCSAGCDALCLLSTFK
jgi:hypothetical protein